MNRQECFDVLDLPADASRDDIVNAHNYLTQVWHPDRFPSDPELRRKSQAKLDKITQAFNVLTEGRHPVGDVEFAEFSVESTASNNAPVLKQKPWSIDGLTVSSAWRNAILVLVLVTLIPRCISWFSRPVAGKPQGGTSFNSDSSQSNTASVASKPQGGTALNLAATSYNNGREAYTRGDLNEALSAYDEAIRLDPTNAPAYVARGRVWMDREEAEMALSDYNEAIRFDPKYANAYMNRGIVWHLKGETEKEVADYNEAIRLDSKNALAYLNRGLMWVANGDTDKALANFNEAIRLDPKNAHAYAARGALWSDKGLTDKALADFNEASRLDPKSFGSVSLATVVPGQGTRNLQIGMPASTVPAILGNPDIPISDGKYPQVIVSLSGGNGNESTQYGKDGNIWRYKMHGIHCYIEGGAITRLDFVYRVGTYASYAGATDKGIGMWSTVGDVVREYGQPEKLDQEVIGSPHRNRLTMHYFALGLGFGFSDGELVYIRVERPELKK